MPLIETVCAHVMRGSAAAFRFFQHKGKHAISNFVQIVAFLFAFPFFHMSNALFKFVYSSRQRRLALLGAQRALLGGQNLSLQFPDLNFDGMSLVQIRDALREVVRGLERRDSFGNSVGVGQD